MILPFRGLKAGHEPQPVIPADTNKAYAITPALLAAKFVVSPTHSKKSLMRWM